MFQPLYNTSCPRLSVLNTKPKTQTKKYSTQQNRKTWLRTGKEQPKNQKEENTKKTQKTYTLT